MLRLENKVAIVTGGAQGIGAAIARRFAEEGARVMLADLNLPEAQKTAAVLAADFGVAVLAHKTDVADQASVEASYAATVQELGKVDILVNNAGVNVFHEPLETTTDEWRKCLSVDLEGAWHCAKAVLPDMIAQGHGAIINIISTHACTVMKSTFPYPVAKHGLLGLTRALALEYADRGIAINAISPGYTDTALAQAEFDKAADPQRMRAEVMAKQPVGRLCHPTEIAAVAAMLASDEARFIIGENIVIDGGVSIRMYE